MPGDSASLALDGFDDFREIGRGGSSTVYAARQVGLDRAVAVKVLHVDLGEPSARRRFERECSVLGALGDSPGIVAVYSAAFTADGRGCIVMRLMRESLADTLRREGPLPVAQVCSIGVTAAMALGHAHSRGVVHRDVKPANLLISEFGEVALSDFDIASVGTMSAMTVTHDSMSPPHAPPERHRGERTGGPSGDIWSLGSTLYTLVAGHPPFGSTTTEGGLAGLIERVTTAPVPPIDRDDLAPELETILRRALAKQPADRWPDVASMGAALAAVPTGRTSSVGARSPRPSARPLRPIADDTLAPPPTSASFPVPPTSADATAENARPADVRNIVTLAVVLLTVLVAVAVALILALR